MSDSGGPVYPWKFPAPHPLEGPPKVNGDHPPAEENARPRRRRIIVDPREWGNGASD